MGLALTKAPRLYMPRQNDYSVCGTPWKNRYDSRGDAALAAKAMKKQSKGQKRGAPPVAPYECRCGGWHHAYSKRA